MIAKRITTYTGYGTAYHCEGYLQDTVGKSDPPASEIIFTSHLDCCMSILILLQLLCRHGPRVSPARPKAAGLIDGACQIRTTASTRLGDW